MSSQNRKDFLNEYNKTHPWMVIYPGIRPEEYLTEEDYKDFVENMGDSENIGVSGGRWLNTKFQKLVPNPNYLNLVKVAKIEKREDLKREYAKLKEQGIFEKIEDFLKWKKEQK